MKKILLTKGKYTIVDDEDFDYLNQSNWYASESHDMYRAKGYMNGKSIYMHRIIMKLKNDQFCDHKNGDPLDNRKENLRICSQAENQRNKKINIKNTSGFKGVVWIKDRKKWEVRIRRNYKNIFIGYFNDIIDAAIAYNHAAKKYHGEFASLNKI